MQNDNIKSYLHLHVIVFIWGFTAILGELISIEEIGLVWYRMTFAGIFMLLFILWKKKRISLSLKEICQLLAVGLLIALHWILFFKAIKVSNVSITLAIFSTGAFMGSILEPIFFNRKLLLYEVLFGLVIVGGLFLIMQVETQYITGAMYALVSVFLGVIFTLFNGKLIKKHDPAVITVYEFFAGAFFVTLYLLFTKQFSFSFFKLSAKDFMLIFVLASICTAYAFTASVKVMQKLSPYTVMLTTNMEPVYGILLAFFMLGEKEKMTPEFYLCAIVVLITVILNGVIKNYKNKSKMISNT
jgi:drug/metabolite transporter (DMT)-like permease